MSNDAIPFVLLCIAAAGVAVIYGVCKFLHTIWKAIKRAAGE